MRCLEVLSAEISYPTDNPNYMVMQPFSSIPAEKSDPFLMCGEHGPEVSTGKPTHPDDFDVGWHPHVGMDIVTYLKEGRGRHADSLGNRSDFASPGFQWTSVGDGIMHAEGGSELEGERHHSFQIWINVPAAHKLDKPRYGTEPPENIPLLEYPGVTARLLAGEVGEQRGPFQSWQPIQMIDFELEAGVELRHCVPPELNNAMLYMYEGSGTICGQGIGRQCVARLAADDPTSRQFAIKAGANGSKVLLFAGKRINEPIVWHGPFVMNSKVELQKVFRQYQTGKFPPERVPWDYKKLAAFPPDQRPSVDNR